jgi:lipopolysaccharide/colanic/teichoic acid biosynthesis glycosyltransferase
VTPTSSALPSPATTTANPLSIVAGAETVETSIAIEPEPLPKRMLDLLFGGFLILATAPAWPVIALAVRLEDGGPVFYRQRRWGQGGKLFEVLKFRTMIPDSDEKHGVVAARDEDERVTRVGRVLRSFGIDELPQVLNILRGEMSFVGPRPLAVGEVVHDPEGNPTVWDHLPEFRRRMSVRPGLTSLATLYLPKDVERKRKFRYDLLYIRRRSLWLDIRLIALSLWVSLSGRWETRQNKI